MSKPRALTLPALLIGGVALLVVGIPSLWLFMSMTAERLHPSPKDAPSVGRSAPSPQWAAAVDEARQIVRDHLSAKNLPGLSVAVGTADDIVWAEGFGFADVDKRGPVSPKHRFRLGTASTVLTSAAVGRLLEQRRLKLDDPIQAYVPEFPKKQWPVTLRHLMGHTAGVQNDGGDEGPLFSVHCQRPAEALRHFAAGKLLFEPGTKFRYSRYGWILVSAAVEAAAKQPFLDYMRDEVFDPAGMGDTAPDSAKNPIPEGTTVYFPRFAADPAYGLQLMRDLDLSCYAGSGVFVSTPSDMVRFGLAVNSGKLLRPDTVRMLHTPQRLASGQETGYGLGWEVKNVPLGSAATRKADNNGDLLGGNATSLVTLPDLGIVVSVMSNISYADTPAVAARIARVFARQPAAPSTD